MKQSRADATLKTWEKVVLQIRKILWNIIVNFYEIWSIKLHNNFIFQLFILKFFFNLEERKFIFAVESRFTYTTLSWAFARKMILMFIPRESSIKTQQTCWRVKGLIFHSKNLENNFDEILWHFFRLIFSIYLFSRTDIISSFLWSVKSTISIKTQFTLHNPLWLWL